MVPILQKVEHLVPIIFIDVSETEGRFYFIKDLFRPKPFCYGQGHEVLDQHIKRADVWNALFELLIFDGGAESG